MAKKSRFSKNFESLQNGTFAMVDMWMHNFARNIPEILVGKNVKILRSSNVVNSKNSAIVIGAGPSIHEKNHLEQLRKSGYDGTIVCTDRMLIPCLKKGIALAFIDFDFRKEEEFLIGIRDNFCYGVGGQQYHLNKNGISVEGIENIILSELNK